jgi:RecA-family ATPase
LEGEAVPERRWVVPDLIPEDECTLLSGDGGEGKTLLQLQLAVACVLGKPWLGRAVRRCRVLAVFCEDNAREIHIRLAEVLAHYGANFGDVAEELAIVCRKGEENALMEWPEWNGLGVPTPLMRRVEALALDHGAELLILDSLHDLFAGEEIKRTHARQFLNALAGIAGRMHGAVFLSMHPSLTGRNTGTGEAGSTAWRNACRSMLYLTRPTNALPDSNERVLKTMKANRARNGGAITVRWQDGVFVASEQPTGIMATAARNAAETAFLDCLRELTRQGRPTSHSKNAHNYAPTVMLQLPRAGGQRRPDLEQAMERLFAARKIKVEQYGRGSRRNQIVEANDGETP